MLQFSGGSAGSGGSSGEEAAAARLQSQENGRSTGSSDVDPSSSEQSADTVIYVGPSDDAATDGEHPPVYIPSLNSGDNRCAMGKALRGSGAEHRPPTKSKSASSSPAKSASTQSKLPNGTSDDKGSPSHRGSSKSAANQSGSKNSSPSHNNSCKSSPVRTASKTTSHKISTDQQQSSSKIPVPFGNTGGSDEQWIDGPRISKSKVAEARSLLKDSHKKKETWIDGPLQSAKLPALTSGHSSGGYGFMDNHKKSMIRKWVENQTVQIQRQTSKHSSPPPPQRPPTTGAPQSHSYKELTVFKTCDEDGVSDTPAIENKPSMDSGSQNDVTKLVKEEAGLMMPDVVLDVKCNGSVKNLDHIEDNQKNNEQILKEMRKDEEENKEEVIHHMDLENVEEDDDVVGDMPPPLQLFQPHNKEISIGKSSSYNYRCLLRHKCNIKTTWKIILKLDSNKSSKELKM